jgi:cob(I)alamin adenosyltransferase
MSVYTKKGDRGETGLFNPKDKTPIRISKNSKLIRTIGAIDEVNSWMGIIKSANSLQSTVYSKKEKINLQKKIREIQEDLFTINAILAGANIRKTCLPAGRVIELEREIDKMEKILPVQKNFIYYGGCEVASMLFFARSLVRRAERSLVSIPNIQYTNPDILIYTNRLSDYLFILARWVNFKEGVREEFWIVKKK